MRRLRVDHLTEYGFAAPVTLLPHRLMLRPRSSHEVRIVSSALEIVPAPATLRWERDALDNSVALATFAGVSQSLRVESSVVIEHYAEAPLDFVVEDYALNHPFSYAADETLLLAPFCALTWPQDRSALDNWLGSLGLRSGSLETFAVLDRLNRAIRAALRYETREQPGVQSPAQTLLRGAGSCRDFAALFMECARQLGLASRFVSGYLYAPASQHGEGATHAWSEVYLPGPGWKGFDPTGGTLTGVDHIAVAVTHHPEKVPPIAGDFVGQAGMRPSLRVGVRVQTLPE